MIDSFSHMPSPNIFKIGFSLIWTLSIRGKRAKPRTIVYVMQQIYGDLLRGHTSIKIRLYHLVLDYGTIFRLKWENQIRTHILNIKLIRIYWNRLHVNITWLVTDVFKYNIHVSELLAVPWTIICSNDPYCLCGTVETTKHYLLKDLISAARTEMINKMGRVKRICVFEHSVMTNFNCACPAIERSKGSGFLFEGSSWLTAYMIEQRRFWWDCLYLRCDKYQIRLTRPKYQDIVCQV